MLVQVTSITPHVSIKLLRRLRSPSRNLSAISYMASSANPSSVSGGHSVGGFSVPSQASRPPLPLRSTTPPPARISVFAREVVRVGKEEKLRMPYLLYLQGGPGFESPRPVEASGWIKKACEDYRVILLDQ
ncbi:uncharacterized protein A4U43_C01F18100, partial [Asparagus officinalis]